MHPKTVRQRAALERQLEALPSLADARRSGAVSYEKTRLIALFAADSPDPWIERARSLPCAALRRLLQADEDRKMCARGAFRAFLPRAVQLLLVEACAAVRRAVGRPLSAGECFGIMCRRFRRVWVEPRGRNTVQTRVRARDGELCQVPGCSRAAEHVHHIVYRSQGGSDDPENLVSLCHAHHHAVHMGWIRVWGRAPGELHWQLGVRPGLPPLVEYHPAAECPVLAA
jgi:hypothetical protein